MGADSLNSGAESPTTKNDRQLHATNVLFETSARLDSGAIILDLCKDLLTDDGASKSRRKRMATTIKNLLIPMQRIASELLADAAKNIAPLPGCREENRKSEVERKTAARSELSKRVDSHTTLEMQLISNFLQKQKANSRKAADDSITPRKKKHRAAKITPLKTVSSGLARGSCLFARIINKLN